jgi:hypothetical protein
MGGRCAFGTPSLKLVVRPPAILALRDRFESIGGLQSLANFCPYCDCVGGGERNRASKLGSGLCGSRRDPSGWADRRRASRPANPRPCPTVPPSRTGCCCPIWSACGANLPAAMARAGSLIQLTRMHLVVHRRDRLFAIRSIRRPASVPSREPAL